MWSRKLSLCCWEQPMRKIPLTSPSQLASSLRRRLTQPSWRSNYSFCQMPLWLPTKGLLSDTLNQSVIYNGMLTEVDKVLHAYFTFPVTSATAERSFSSLHRITTFLQSTMTQETLNNLFQIYIHSERTDALDLVIIAKEFVAVNNDRMNYFGKF